MRRCNLAAIIRGEYHETGIGFVIAFAAASPATAGICWVEKVYAWGDGVALKFEESAPRWIDVVTKTERTYQRWYGSDEIYIQQEHMDQWPLPEGPRYAALPVKIGDQVTLSNSPHDGCMIEVARSGDQIGIKSSASFFLHGIHTQPEQRVEFVPAEMPPDDFQLSP